MFIGIMNEFGEDEIGIVFDDVEQVKKFIGELEQSVHQSADPHSVSARILKGLVRVTARMEVKDEK